LRSCLRAWDPPVGPMVRRAFSSQLHKCSFSTQRRNHSSVCLRRVKTIRLPATAGKSRPRTRARAPARRSRRCLDSQCSRSRAEPPFRWPASSGLRPFLGPSHPTP